MEDQAADFDILKGCQNVEISDELGFGVWNTNRRTKLKLGQHRNRVLVKSYCFWTTLNASSD